MRSSFITALPCCAALSSPSSLRGGSLGRRAGAQSSSACAGVCVHVLVCALFRGSLAPPLAPQCGAEIRNGRWPISRGPCFWPDAEQGIRCTVQLWLTVHGFLARACNSCNSHCRAVSRIPPASLRDGRCAVCGVFSLAVLCCTGVERIGKQEGLETAAKISPRSTADYYCCRCWIRLIHSGVIV